MFKTQIEYTPVLIEAQDGEITLAFFIGQEASKIRVCKRLLKTDSGLLPLEPGYIWNEDIKTITKLEVKNEQ